MKGRFVSDMQIPGLELLEKLGEGGMASVWKARQMSLDRIVAVKILPSEATRDSEQVKRFHTEAKSAAKLKHPGIVQVYDVNFESGLYYIVMEFVDGYTVRDWLRRTGKLSENEALQVVDSVADALGYAWDKERIIHCDIKPDNIMVDSDGSVKVADLGLARSISAATAGPAESHVIGTPAYMAPEQIVGVSDPDCRADVYSLGAMLYELLTGHHLFHGNTEEQVLEMQIKDTVEDPHVSTPKLSKGTVWLLEKMLAKKRERRHQTWAEVQEDVAKVRKGKLFSPLVGEGESTVRRSKLLTGMRKALPTKTHADGKEKSILPIVFGIAGVIVVAVFVVVILNLRHGSVSKLSPTVTVPSVATQAPDAIVGRLFDEALVWSRDNSTRYTEAIERFKNVLSKAKGTRYAPMAQSLITDLSNQRESAIQGVLAQIKGQTAPLTENRKYADAAEVYESYNGELSAETKSIRDSIAQQLREDQQSVAETATTPATVVAPSANAQGDAQTRFENLLDSISVRLLSDGIEGAQAELTTLVASQDLSSKMVEIQPVKELLEAAAALNSRIMDSFIAQKGLQIAVSLKSGQISFVVSEVSEGKVTGVQKRGVGSAVASIPLSFGIKDLAPREKVQRLGAGDSQEIALFKGLMAFSSKAYPLAKTYFAKTSRLLSDRLIARIPRQ